MRIRRTVLVLAAAMTATLLLAAPSAEAASPAPTLGPKPARCGVGCWGARDVLSVSWLADFTVDPLIARKGDRLTATVAPLNHGGHLKGWTWPWPGCKPNTATCKFRANSAARRWFRIGMHWQNDVGGATTEAVWAVIGKNEELISGYVRDEAGDGVGGVRVNLARKGGRKTLYAVTGGDGFYNALVKAGTYHVYPQSRAKKRDRFVPESKTVKVKEGKAKRVDFTLRKSMKVTLTATRTLATATGDDAVDLLVKVVRDGAPLAGTRVDVWPERSTPAEKLAVPLVLCNGAGRFWPTADPGKAGASLPQAVTTDAKGEARLRLFLGSTPGTTEIQAWAEDARGALRTKNLDDVRDEITITVKPRPGGRVGSLSQLRNAIQTYVASKVITLPTGNATILAKALNDMAIPGNFSDVVFSPITKSTDGEEAVLATLAPKHPILGAAGAFTTTEVAMVIPFRRLSPALTTLFGGFAGAVRAGQLPDLPTLARWQAGAPEIGWNVMPGIGRQSRPGSWLSFGWPNASAPGCPR